MERVVVGLSPFSRRSRSLAVSHVATGLAQGLEPGDHVVVHDPDEGDDFSAIVADIQFDLEDTIYRLELGTRITAEEAAGWIAPAPIHHADPGGPAGHPGHEGTLSAGQLLALLGELRRRERALHGLLDTARS